MAGEILVGNDAIDRVSTPGISEATWVDREHSATLNGKLKLIKVYSPSPIINVRAASFYVVSGNNLSTRDWVTIGSVPSGYSEHVVDFNIEVGDYLGLCGTSDGPYGSLDLSTNGSLGAWRTAGLHIPATNYAFTLYSNWVLSMQGIGDILVGGPAIAVLTGVLSGSINTVNNIAWSEIAKINGVG